MINHDDPSLMRSKISYLEGKCAFLTKQLENAVLSSSEHVVLDGVVNIALRDEVIRLRSEKELLEMKISFLYNSVSWRITRPIRSISIPIIDRWIKGLK